MKKNCVAIVPAAGKGTRAGMNQNKLFTPIGGKTVLERTLLALSSTPLIQRIIVAVNPAEREQVQQIAARIPTPTCLVDGGDTRTQSVKNALDAASGADVVLIHDGARPYASSALIERALLAASEHGSAVAALPLSDTVSVTAGGVITHTPDRSTLVRVQTPQAFDCAALTAAYARIAPEQTFTDDASVYAAFVAPPHVIEGERDNIKLTHPEDFAVAGKYFCGTGFDVHQLTEGRRLVLGGVTVPHNKGLLGHSDADVLAHAICDALLSAAALGDIGKHFPDTDAAYKNANSIVLLRRVVAMLREKGFAVWNVSATVMAEKPKLAPHIPQMQSILAAACGINAERVGIAATTTEGLGFVGREEGIAAHASALIVKEN